MPLVHAVLTVRLPCRAIQACCVTLINRVPLLVPACMQSRGQAGVCGWLDPDARHEFDELQSCRRAAYSLGYTPQEIDAGAALRALQGVRQRRGVQRVLITAARQRASLRAQRCHP
jgi:hypothetical protein